MKSESKSIPTNSAISAYYDALERLKKNEPIYVGKGTPISKQSVAMEAGKHRSSIVKSRKVFLDLSIAIEDAKKSAISQRSPSLEEENNRPDPNWKDMEIERLKKLYESTLVMEISLAEQLSELLKEIAALKSDKVTPFPQVCSRCRISTK